MKILKGYLKQRHLKILSLMVLVVVCLFVSLLIVSCTAGTDDGPVVEDNGSVALSPDEAACHEAVSNFMEAGMAQDVDTALENTSSGAYTSQELTDAFLNYRQFYDGYKNIEMTSFNIDDTKDIREALYLGTVRYEDGYKGWVSADMIEEDGTWLIESFIIDVEPSRKESYQN